MRQKKSSRRRPSPSGIVAAEDRGSADGLGSEKGSQLTVGLQTNGLRGYHACLSSSPWTLFDESDGITS
ncbi:hypothetical protein PG990_003949 [Apiospora arundinis]